MNISKETIMKDRVSFNIKNNRINFKFQIERNVTIISGDSGTGKTKLFNMVRAYELYGKKDSGITLNCKKNCITLVDREDWFGKLDSTVDSIVFIDEASEFLRTQEFARAIQKSDNYYVIITRESLPQIPYSIDAIKEIIKNGAVPELRKIYSNISLKDISKYKYEVLITEDSEAGYQLFEIVADKMKADCISAGGKTKLLDILKKYSHKRVVVVADAAALGSEIHELVKYKKLHDEYVEFFLPESFEWMILKSGIVGNENIKTILKDPVKYIDSQKYFSWERYFTDLLISETASTPGLEYSKKRLAKGYTSDANVEKIINATKKK